MGHARTNVGQEEAIANRTTKNILKHEHEPQISEWWETKAEGQCHLTLGESKIRFASNWHGNAKIPAKPRAHNQAGPLGKGLAT